MGRWIEELTVGSPDLVAHRGGDIGGSRLGEFLLGAPEDERWIRDTDPSGVKREAISSGCPQTRITVQLNRTWYC